MATWVRRKKAAIMFDLRRAFLVGVLCVAACGTKGQPTRTANDSSEGPATSSPGVKKANAEGGAQDIPDGERVPSPPTRSVW
jgi:hypothetical protein